AKRRSHLFPATLWRQPQSQRALPRHRSLVRCLKWLVREGYLKDEVPEPAPEPTLLEMCLQSAVGLGQLAALSRKGAAIATSESGHAVKQKIKAGVFNVHVGEP